MSDWTVDTLREYFQTRLDAAVERAADQHTAMRHELDLQHRAAEKAVEKAEHAVEKRLDAVSELRRQVADQQAHYLTRTEYNAGHQALAEKIDILAARVDAQAGSTSTSYRFIGWGLTATSVIIAGAVFLANYVFS